MRSALSMLSAILLLLSPAIVFGRGKEKTKDKAEAPAQETRHTFASQLIMASVDVRTVAELLRDRTLVMLCATPIWPRATSWKL